MTEFNKMYPTVYSKPGIRYFDLLKKPLIWPIEGIGYGFIRSKTFDKNLPVSGLRPSMLQIINEGISNFSE